MDFSTVAIGGIALIPLVIGLVAVIKGFGVSGKTLTAIALGIGFCAGIVVKLVEMYPSMERWVTVVVYGIAFGLFALAATGIYDLGKAWLGTLGSGSTGAPAQITGSSIPPGNYYVPTSTSSGKELQG